MEPRLGLMAHATRANGGAGRRKDKEFSIMRMGMYSREDLPRTRPTAMESTNTKVDRGTKVNGSTIYRMGKERKF
jgi:hypothetical protein